MKGMPIVQSTSVFASSSLARHLLRGCVGFGLIAGAIALAPVLGAGSLLLAPLGLVVLRGCPTCWLLGLVETVSAGRLKRACADGSCALDAKSPVLSADGEATSPAPQPPAPYPASAP
jgi:hypothetical protein